MMAESVTKVLFHQWPLILLIISILYLLKNRFNRGLNKYPGPFVASLTDWWRFWDVYQRRPEVTHIKLHAKHGDVVRLGPNVLSFASPKALKAIYGLNKGFTKSEFYPVQQAVSKGHRLPSLFSTLSEPFHAQLRRSVNSAFSMSTIIQYEPFVDSTTELFLSQTEKIYMDSGAACDFSRWLQFYAFDVIGEMTYSKRFGFLEEDKDIDGIIGYIAGIFNYSGPVGQIPILDRLLLKNPLYLLASQYGLIDVTVPIARFVQERMRGRFLGDSSLLPKSTGISVRQPDLISKFIQAKVDHPEFMTDSLVVTMGISMVFAGSDTTSISIAAIFYYLLKNPSCMKKLQDELDERARNGHFQDNKHGLVTWVESQDLPYLDACVKEAFRMHPAAGLPLERVVPPQGAEIAGVFVKGGTIVGCSAWVLHRRNEIFGEGVEVFRPERWLVGQGRKIVQGEEKEREEKRVKDMGSTMLQFGMGARTCIGKNISLLEIYKLVPTVLRRFVINLEYPDLEWKIHNAWFVRQLGFRTTFTKRELIQPISRQSQR